MEHNNLIKYILGISNSYNYKEFILQDSIGLLKEAKQLGR